MTAQLSRERLEEIASLPLKTTSCGLQHAPGAYSTVYSHEIVEMARMLLAGMDSEPVAFIAHYESGLRAGVCDVDDTVKMEWLKRGLKVSPLYATPSTPVAVPDEKWVNPDIGYADENGFAEGWNESRQYAIAKGVIPPVVKGISEHCRGWNAFCAAMLKAGPVTGWIKCCERMPPSKTAVIVGCWFGRNWATKWATYLPSHEDAQKSGFLMPGGSWTPTHWMPLPAAPEQEV